MKATGHAHPVGDGLNAHAWINAIEQLVHEAPAPVVIRVVAPLPLASRRLMDTLGVTVVVGGDAA